MRIIILLTLVSFISSTDSKRALFTLFSPANSVPSILSTDKTDKLNVKWNRKAHNITPVGERQYFLLGEALFERLVNVESYLSGNLTKSDIYFTTFDKQTSKTSLAALLNGFFEKAGEVKMDESLRNIAVPPFPVPNLEEKIAKLNNYAIIKGVKPIAYTLLNKDEKEDISAALYNCVYLQNSKENKASNKFALFKQEFDKKYTAVITANTSLTAAELNSFDDLSSLLDSFRANFYENNPLPAPLLEQIDLKENIELLYSRLLVEVLYEDADNLSIKILLTNLTSTLLKYFENRVAADGENTGYTHKNPKAFWLVSSKDFYFLALHFIEHQLKIPLSNKKGPSSKLDFVLEKTDIYQMKVIWNDTEIVYSDSWEVFSQLLKQNMMNQEQFEEICEFYDNLEDNAFGVAMIFVLTSFIFLTTGWSGYLMFCKKSKKDYMQIE